MPKILVVDDEPDAVELVEFNLRGAGFDVVTAADGAEAIRKARSFTPDLILLDVMLPELDGLEVCKLLRRDPTTSAVPIIMLTAKAAEIDRVLGLELGADDYVTKPFSPRELVLRVKSLLRRGQSGPAKLEQFRAGELAIDVSRHRVTVAGKRVDLTATEGCGWSMGRGRSHTKQAARRWRFLRIIAAGAARLAAAGWPRRAWPCRTARGCSAWRTACFPQPRPHPECASWRSAGSLRSR